MIQLRPQPDDPLAHAEGDMAVLSTVLEGCANPGVSRQALLIDLSALPAVFAKPHHLRMIAGALDPLLGLDRARLFRTPRALVLIWRGDAQTTVEPALAALRRLFADLPDAAHLVQRLDLPHQVGAIAQSMVPVQALAVPQDAGTTPLDAAELAMLEAAFAQVDVAPYARRRRILRCAADTRPIAAFEHRYLNIAALVDSVVPGMRPRPDTWLFRRLTRTLDRRLLSLLAHPIELRRAGPFALDLNIASILGPEFLNFDASLPTGLRGKIVLAVQAADLVSDTASYEFARAFCTARSYRLMLRAMAPGWLDVLPAAALGLDLVELSAASGPVQLPSDIDRSAIVLTSVEDPGMAQWGLSNRITLFEGSALAPRP